jgi:hypothetical protein
MKEGLACSPLLLSYGRRAPLLDAPLLARGEVIAVRQLQDLT